VPPWRSWLFPDNWIYVHDGSVQAGRIQNFKNWSPEMVPDPSRTSLGLEYFCNEGDALWRLPDRELVALAREEIERIGLARAADVEDGCVVRVSKAYPVYDATYADSLATVRAWVAASRTSRPSAATGCTGTTTRPRDAHGHGGRVQPGPRRARTWRSTDQACHERSRRCWRRPRWRPSRAPSPAFPKVDRTALGLALGAATGLVLCLTSPWPRAGLRLHSAS
jgi:hypothetical protein